MSQTSNVEVCNREAETKRRVEHNRKIDAIVKLSLVGKSCKCGSNNLKQNRKGSYIVRCINCNSKHRLGFKV